MICCRVNNQIIQPDHMIFHTGNFPVHSFKDFLNYNLYRTSQQGEQTDDVIKYPVVAENCTTQCYIDLQDYQNHKKQYQCPVCKHPRNKFYIDIGYQQILNLLRQKLNRQKPIFIQINPYINKFYIPKVRHNIIGALANVVGEQFADQITGFRNELYFNYFKLKKMIKDGFGQVKPASHQNIYSWCRKWSQTHKQQPQMFLFFVNKKQPVKIKLSFELAQINEEFAQQIYTAFYQSCSVNFIGKLKIFVICLVTRRSTYYFASHFPNSFNEKKKQLNFKLFHQEKFVRLHCCSFVHQQLSRVYFFGGFQGGDPLEETSPHIIQIYDISWEGNNFIYKINNSCQLFKMAPKKVILSNSKYPIANKDHFQCLRSSTIIRHKTASKVCTLVERKKFYNQNNDTIIWLGVGGSSIYNQFSSGKVVNLKPGTRTIICQQNKSFILQQSGDNYNYDFSFNFPFVVDFPLTNNQEADEKYYKNKILVFGGVYADDSKNQKVYFFDSQLVRAIEVKNDQFPFRNVSRFSDNFSTLLFDKKQKIYIRYTIPCVNQIIRDQQKLEYYIIQIFMRKYPPIFKVTPGYVKIQ